MLKRRRIGDESNPRRFIGRYTHRAETLVLDGLSFHAKPGEVVALCGPSGGGKSSCISLIEGLYRPEAGEVLLDDVNVLELDRRWFHRQVGLVAQEPVLFARSIRSNIIYGLEDSPPSEEERRRRLPRGAHPSLATCDLQRLTSTVYMYMHMYM